MDSMFSLLLLLCSPNFSAGYDFSPFDSENVTMAVFIDKEFFNDETQYEFYLQQIPNLIERITKVYMRFTSISGHILEDLNINLRPDYTILLTVTNCKRTWRSYNKARREELVHVAVTDPDCPRLPKEESLSVPLVEPGFELSQILLDLRMNRILPGRNLNIIFDNSSDRDNIKRVLHSLSTELPDKKIRLTSNSLFTIGIENNLTAVEQKITSILENFNEEQLGHSFIVIVTADIVKIVMKVAKLLKLAHPENQWIYIISDNSKKNINVTQFNAFSVEGENVAFIYNVTSPSNTCNINLMCYVSELLRSIAISVDNLALNRMSVDQRDMDEEFDALRLTKSKRKSEIVRNVNREFFRKDIVTSDCGLCLSWQITSTVTWGNSLIAENETERYVDTGFWTLGIGVDMWDSLFPHLLQGFRGRLLPLLTYHNPPWQIVKATKSGAKIYEGLVFDILFHLSQKMNFSYSVMLLVTGEITEIMHGNNRKSNISTILDNAAMSTAQKTPEDVVKLLKEGKVFLAACASSTLDKPMTGVNFTLPISTQAYGLLAPNPVILSRALLFIAPFKLETWACLGVVIIIISPILYLVQKCCLHLLDDVEEPPGLRTPWQCIWYIYGALLQQGGMHLPRMSSGRIVIGIWWLVVMVLVAMYSGVLVAFLTFPRMDDAISSIDDLLARKDEFTWGFPNGSIVEEYLGGMNDSKHKEFLRRAERHNSSDVEKIINRIKGKKHVLIDWTTSLRFLMRADLLSTGYCHFTLSSTEIMKEPISLMLSNDSPYLKLINKELTVMHESGLIKKWTSDRMPVRDQCWEGRIINPATKHKVNMGDMQGIFFVLAIGFSAAVTIIGCEFLFNRRKRARERNLVRPFTN